MKKKLIVCLISAFLFISAFFVFADVSGILPGAEVKINVEEGEGLKTVAAKIKKSGVIYFAPLFEIYARAKGFDTKIKAGEHTMEKNMGYEKAVSVLTCVSENSGDITFTVPEGFEIYRLAEKAADVLDIPAEEFLSAQNDEFSFDFLSEIPMRENRLEGYLFPDTYRIKKDSSAKELIEKMLSRFSEIWTDEFTARSKDLGMTTDEVIILASIIEREAGSKEEMGKVSSVFHNRLKIGMPLQSCATVQYILKERKDVLSIEDTKISSPYNTYINTGLPIGPISSPGKDAITAALYPEDTDYYYFKVGEDGKTVFSKTLKEHNS